MLEIIINSCPIKGNNLFMQHICFFLSHHDDSSDLLNDNNYRTHNNKFLKKFFKREKSGHGSIVGQTFKNILTLLLLNRNI